MNEKDKKDEGKVFDSEKHSYQTIKARPVKLKDNYDYFNIKWYKRPFTRLAAFIVLFLMKIFVGPVFFGFKVVNKKALRSAKREKTGYIYISNHIHPFDAFLTASAIFTKRIYITMLMTNLGIPVAGKVMKFLAGVPIPENKNHFRDFKKQMKIVLDRGAWIAVYPESALEPYCDHIRPFEKGAIRFALDNDVNILPMVYVFKKPRGLYRLYKRKPLLHLHILEPYKLEIKDSKHETVEYNSNVLENMMRDYLEKQKEVYKSKEKKKTKK